MKNTESKERLKLLPTLYLALFKDCNCLIQFSNKRNDNKVNRIERTPKRSIPEGETSTSLTCRWLRRICSSTMLSVEINRLVALKTFPGGLALTGVNSQKHIQFNPHLWKNQLIRLLHYPILALPEDSQLNLTLLYSHTFNNSKE